MATVADELLIRVSADDRASAPLRSLNALLLTLGRTSTATASRFVASSRSWQASSQAMAAALQATNTAAQQGFGQIPGLAGAAARAIDDLSVRTAHYAMSSGREAINAAMGWEAQMKAVERVSGKTAEQMEELSDQLKDMGTKFARPTQELAKAAEEAARLGIEGDNLLKFVEITDKFAIGVGGSAATSATALAKLKNIFRKDIGESMLELEKLASAVVAVDQESASTAPQIMASLSKMAAAVELGFKPGALIGYSAALIGIGRNADLAGTQVSSAIGDMLKSKKLDQAAAAVGMTTRAFKALFDSNPQKAFELVISSLKKMTSESDKFALAEKIFGRIGAKAVVPLSGMLGEVARLQATANEEIKNGTVITDAFNKNMESTRAQVGLAKNALFALSQEFGDRFLPHIKAAAQFVVKLAGHLRETMKAMSDTSITTGGVAAALLALSTIRSGGILKLGRFILGIGTAATTASAAVAPAAAGIGASLLGLAGKIGPLTILFGKLWLAMKLIQHSDIVVVGYRNIGTALSDLWSIAKDEAIVWKQWEDSLRDSGKSVREITDEIKELHRAQRELAPITVAAPPKSGSLADLGAAAAGTGGAARAAFDAGLPTVVPPAVKELGEILKSAATDGEYLRKLAGMKTDWGPFGDGLKALLDSAPAKNLIGALKDLGKEATIQGQAIATGLAGVPSNLKTAFKDGESFNKILRTAATDGTQMLLNGLVSIAEKAGIAAGKMGLLKVPDQKAAFTPPTKELSRIIESQVAPLNMADLQSKIEANLPKFDKQTTGVFEYGRALNKQETDFLAVAAALNTANAAYTAMSFEIARLQSNTAGLNQSGKDRLAQLLEERQMLEQYAKGLDSVFAKQRSSLEQAKPGVANQIMSDLRSEMQRAANPAAEAAAATKPGDKLTEVQKTSMEKWKITVEERTKIFEASLTAMTNVAKIRSDQIVGAMAGIGASMQGLGAGIGPGLAEALKMPTGGGLAQADMQRALMGQMDKQSQLADQQIKLNEANLKSLDIKNQKAASGQPDELQVKIEGGDGAINELVTKVVKEIMIQARATGGYRC